MNAVVEILALARVGLIALSMAVPALAQRSWAGATYADDAGRSILHNGQATSASWGWQNAQVYTRGVVSLPTAQSSHASLVAPNVFLVSGRFWLCEVRIDTSSGTPVASAVQIESSGRDVVSFAYSDVGATLFAIDGMSHSLIVAPYQPGSAPGQWRVVATSAQCPDLLNASFLELTPTVDGSGVVMSGVEPYDAVEFEFLLNGSIWTMTNLADAAIAVPLPPCWFVGDYPTMSADGTAYMLWIGGGSGLFHVVDSTGVPVFSGMHSGVPCGEVVSIPVASLSYGGLYRVVDGAAQGLLPSVPFRAKVVWAVASMLDPVSPERLGFRWDFPAVGTDFISWQLHWAGAAAPPPDTWIMTMALGGWSYQTVPTVGLAGVEVLGAVYGDLGLRFASWQDKKMAFNWVLAVNDPIFVGFRVAAQGIGLAPTGHLFVSDVVGVVLRQ